MSDPPRSRVEQGRRPSSNNFASSSSLSLLRNDSVAVEVCCDLGWDLKHDLAVVLNLPNDVHPRHESNEDRGARRTASGRRTLRDKVLVLLARSTRGSVAATFLLFRQGGGKLSFGRTDWSGALLRRPHRHNEAEFRGIKVPLKEVVYWMKHCEVGPDPEDPTKFGIVITPRNDQGPIESPLSLH